MLNLVTMDELQEDPEQEFFSGLKEEMAEEQIRLAEEQAASERRQAEAEEAYRLAAEEAEEAARLAKEARDQEDLALAEQKRL